MMINVEIRGDKVAFLSYSGQFREIEVPMLTQDIMHQIKKIGGDVKIVVLDVSSISYINAAGVASLIRIRRFCEEKSFQFKLFSPAKWVRYVLALTKVDTIIQYT